MSGKKGEKILFCGAMVPEKIEYQVRDISAAGNRFQNNMVRYLEKAGYEVICCSFLGMHIPLEIKAELSGNYVFKDEGLLKGIWEYHSLLKRTMSDIETVICYNIAYAWLFLPIMAKRKHKCNIVIAADYSESISYKSLPRKIYARLQLWSMRRFDKVIGLSVNIKNKLRKRQQFTLMEGGIDERLYNAFVYRPHETDRPITFMYSGLLNHVTGIDVLLEALKQIKRLDIRLVISGKGEMEDKAVLAAKEDDRISYLGHMPYEEYVQKLQEADVFINPRNMDLPENQNNFPSKIMDYLAAGKPIISTKFPGWEKFEENIVFCENGAEGLKTCLRDADQYLKDTEELYVKNRERARHYIWEEQIKRVL